MDTYHQLALFDLEVYTSEPICLEDELDSQVKKEQERIKFEQLELDLYPKLSQLTQCSFEHLSQAA